MITAIALGVLVGLVLGLTGAGGSIFAVPLLIWGLGWTLPQAVPVALLAVCIGAGFGTVVAWDVRLVRYRAALLMALGAWLMAPFGLHAARVLAVDILTLSFALVLLLLGVRLLIQASRTPDDAAVVRATVAVCHLDPGTGRFDWTPLSLAVISAIGALTGFLSGMLGVGGGFVIVPSLRAVTDLSMHSAVATSLMAIALISGGTVGGRGIAGSIHSLAGSAAVCRWHRDRDVWPGGMWPRALPARDCSRALPARCWRWLSRWHGRCWAECARWPGARAMSVLLAARRYTGAVFRS